MTHVTVPFLTGIGDLRACVASVRSSRADVLIIHNGQEPMHGEFEDYVLHMPHNLGVAASWNLGIKSDPSAPYWLFANHDTVLAPGDLDRLIAELEKDGPRWVGMNGDWRVMGLTREAVETVGWFDENFVPCYMEDCDYEYRCKLAGVPWYFIEGGATHVGSASIREPRYREGNQRSYPRNVAYYVQKWGGSQRGGETFTSPFNRGGHWSEGTQPSIQRLRDLAW